MRIFSPTIWALPALLFSSAIADNPPQNEMPTFIFDGNYFQGQFFAPNRSSVFDFDQLKQQEKNFIWNQNQTSQQVEILQVDLMSNGSLTVASWCQPDEKCNSTEGFSGSYNTDLLPIIDSASVTDNLSAQYHRGRTGQEERLH